MPYNRPPLTKELLRGESSEDELPIEAGSVVAGAARSAWSAVARSTLDPRRRTVSLSGGRELRYRSCVLATGAEPTRLPVPGADHPAVRVIRTLDHVRELIARLRDGDAVVVIGSGFIGCEIAASLRRRGHPVALVSDEDAAQRGAPRSRGGRSASAAGWCEEGVERQARGRGRGDRGDATARSRSAPAPRARRGRSS